MAITNHVVTAQVSPLAQTPTIVAFVPIPTSPPDRSVAVVIYDGLCTFEYGIAVEVFGLDRPEMGPDWYSLTTCAIEPGPLRALGGVSVSADAGLEALDTAGTIVIPGWRGVAAAPPEPLLEALRRASTRGARIVSICSGAFVLAAAGLLEGRAATTHWRYADAFRSAFPDIRLSPEVLYVDEGAVLTSAGSAAGIDLLLHVVRLDFGAQAANSVARRLVAAAHRDGGQAQFIERPVPPRANGRLAPLLDEMRARIIEPMSLAALAQRAAMSRRTFLRQFKALTGTTPAAWILEERLAAARQLLEAGDPRIDTVALATGFGSAATFRARFRRRFGTGPGEYRRRFMAAGPGESMGAGLNRLQDA